MLGISFAGIEPAFVSFRTYEQFCCLMDEHDPTAKKISIAHSIYKQSNLTCLAALQSYLTALLQLKEMVGASVENTLRCYWRFTRIRNIVLNRKEEDFVMLLSVFSGCGISIDITEKKLHDEDLFTERFRVREFVNELWARYDGDPEVQQLLNAENA